MNKEQIDFLIERIRKATAVTSDFSRDVVAYSTLTCADERAESWEVFTPLRFSGYTWTLDREIPTKLLRLADTVRIGNATDGFTIAVVVKVTDTEVEFFAPYVTTGDFSYTGGVIPYIGVQQWKVPRTMERSYFVYHRKELA